MVERVIHATLCGWPSLCGAESPGLVSYCTSLISEEPRFCLSPGADPSQVENTLNPELDGLLLSGVRGDTTPKSPLPVLSENLPLKLLVSCSPASNGEGDKGDLNPRLKFQLELWCLGVGDNDVRKGVDGGSKIAEW